MNTSAIRTPGLMHILWTNLWTHSKRRDRSARNASAATPAQH